MKTLYKIIHYLNPVARLGKRQYSVFLPLFVSIFVSVTLECYVYFVLHDPNVVGLYAIFLYIGLIIFFSFRDGVRGGFTATAVTIVYYFYIIYTRHHQGQQLITSIETTIILGILYMFLGGVIGWLKQTIDKLIEKEADERRRLQTIIQQLPVGIVITDNQGRVQHSNKQLESILGIKLQKDLVAGRDIIIPVKHNGKEINASQTPLAYTLATGKPITDKEYVIQRSDSKKVHMNINTSLIHGQRGRVIAAAAIVNDITQQKELESRKDDFVNMASHELKTPVTSLKLYSSLLKKHLEKLQDEKGIKTIISINQQTERLQDLINDLLDVSRLQTGKLMFTKENFRLDLVIRETIAGLKAASKKQEIKYKGTGAVAIFGDKFRIYQVLTNLLTNAMKYSPEHEKIIVQIRKEDKKVIVSVQDFGIGIAKDQQKKVFDRLYQVTEPKEKTFPGLGMGLYISKEIIKRHRGTIWVESEKGKGSTFYFSLPLSKK